MQTVKATKIQKGDALLSKNRHKRIGIVYLIEENESMVTVRYKTEKGDYASITIPKSTTVHIEREYHL